MIRLDDILDKIATYAPGAQLELIERAYILSARCHEGQKRRSGEPYLIHPLAVANIIADLRLDVDSIAVGLLHDVIEDTLVTYEEVKDLFGQDIADMVDGLSKISKMQFKSKAEAQAENFRKMLFAMAKDIRVVLVKLADRLHNMLTLEHMPPHKQKVIAQETLDIYAPIANRLGIQTIKIELEDLAFKYLHPEKNEEIQSKLEASRAERERYMERVRGMLKAALKKNDIPCQISGRVKHSYSIYRKMVRNSVEFEQIYDLTAFRVLVENIGQCYQVLGLVHAMYRPVSSRFKDYIAVPKTNGYRSLHTTVIGPENEQIEIQIRTADMHQVAESGIAAHWRYKEGKLALDRREIEEVARLRQLAESARDTDDPAEFMDAVRADLYTDDVYVFTPAGEVKAFPEGATPLDFAFSVHTEVGLHCAGAKVSGRIVPFSYKLENGDTVEIITHPGARPSTDWLEHVGTGRARNKIRAFLHQEERIQAREIGHEILDREFRKLGLNLNKLIKEDKFVQPLQELKQRTMDDLFLAVSYGNMPLDRVLLQFVSPEKLEALKPESKPVGMFDKLKEKLLPTKKPATSSSPVLVRGEGDILVSFAKCCHPLHGDPIIGIITRGQGIAIHMAECANALSIDPERRIDVAWDDKAKFSRVVRIRVICVDQSGMLSSMSKAIGHKGVNITSAECKSIGDRKAVNFFEVAVQDRTALDDVMWALERIKGVISVERVTTT